MDKTDAWGSKAAQAETQAEAVRVFRDALLAGEVPMHTADRLTEVWLVWTLDQ